MAVWYYFNQNNQRFGPYDKNALAEFARQKKITPNTVFVTEDGRYQRAGEIPNLFPAPSNPFTSGTQTQTQTQPPGSAVCANCGNPLRPEQIICLKCGVPVARQTPPETIKAEGKSMSILTFLGICVLVIFFSFIGIGIITDLEPRDFFVCSPLFGVAFLMIMILIVIAMFVRRDAKKINMPFLSRQPI